MILMTTYACYSFPLNPILGWGWEGPILKGKNSISSKGMITKQCIDCKGNKIKTIYLENVNLPFRNFLSFMGVYV